MNRIIIILLMVSVYIAEAVAEPSVDSGVLSGKVTDKRSGEPLVGATIYFTNLTTGTTTDINGEYIIKNLPLRNVSLQVSYLGRVCSSSMTRLYLQLERRRQIYQQSIRLITDFLTTQPISRAI